MDSSKTTTGAAPISGRKAVAWLAAFAVGMTAVLLVFAKAMHDIGHVTDAEIRLTELGPLPEQEYRHRPLFIVYDMQNNNTWYDWGDDVRLIACRISPGGELTSVRDVRVFGRVGHRDKAELRLDARWHTATTADDVECRQQYWEKPGVLDSVFAAFAEILFGKPQPQPAPAGAVAVAGLADGRYDLAAAVDVVDDAVATVTCRVAVAGETAAVATVEDLAARVAPFWLTVPFEDADHLDDVPRSDMSVECDALKFN